ncbi:retrovirus-related pol polyprotein from transposon TNT 1-94 [Tanacetum coccineum]|uniref:Retrovirus-related pol polyprotein from transposon TNT 1-94 n=1 Tax=Tanacetum coccineum TaxID=301880 RepID=A0ABQ5BHL2_9ASTR
MANLSEDIQCAGSDTRPPMLDRTDFASWQQRIRLYCRGKENGVNILKSIDKGPFQMGTFWETLVEGNEGALHLGPRVYYDLSPEDKDRMQLNSKFVNNMLPEWGRFVTAVKLNRGLSLTDNLIENLTNTLALLTQSYKKYLPQTNNQLRTSSNARNQATVQDGRVVVQNVQGRQNRGQGNNARGTCAAGYGGAQNRVGNGTGAAGYGGAQNRIGNANPGQARLIKCYNRNGIGHIACNCTQPKHPQNSKYFKDKMLLMQAQENRVTLDEEQLLFIASGQDNAVDEDVDEQPVQDLALTVDNGVSADVMCDAFDSDVDEAPTAQTMFMENLSSADPVYDEAIHEMHDDVQLNYVVDSHADYMSDSNMILYDQYVKDNAVSVVQSNESSVPNDAYMMILNDIYEPSAQCVSVTTQYNVVDNSLTAELATYKEQVELYERRAKFELTEREQNINEQLRIVIVDRNLKEENLKRELHSVKRKLTSTINHNKSMVEEVSSLKKVFKQKENKYLKEPLDMKALKEKVNDKLYKQDQSLQIVHMLCKPKPYYNEQNKIAETTRKLMNEKMKDPEYVKKKVKILPHDYSKENYLTTFTPQKQLTPEQIFWSKDLIKMKAEALKEQTTASRPIKALTVYPPNTPATLVPSVLPTKIQLEAEVDQNAVNKKHDEIERKNILTANDNLIADCLSKEVFYIATNSELTISRFTEMHDDHTVVQARCLELEAELSKLHDKITQLTEKVIVLQEQNELFRVENAKFKQRYKELYDSIKITRAKHIEQTTALLTKNENLKAQIHENLKCITMDSVKPRVLALGRYDIDVEPIPPHNRNNREVHLDYLKHLKESVKTLREIVEEAKVERPLDISLESACLYTKHSQELLEYVIGTCPKDFNKQDKKHASTPLTRKKQVTFEDQCETSNNNAYKHVEKLNIQKTNVTVIPSTGVNNCIDASGSQPRRNTKKNKISPAKSVNKKKVEEHPRTNKSSLKITNRVDSSISSKRTVINSNSHSVCQTCRTDHPLVFGLRLLKTYDGGLLTAQEFHEKNSSDTSVLMSEYFTFPNWKFIQRSIQCLVEYSVGGEIIKGTINDLVERILYVELPEIEHFHQKLVPRTPQQNDVVERRNRTLVEAARTMLIFSKASMFLWAEAVATAYAPSPSHSPSSSALQSPSSQQGVAAGSTIMEDNPFAPVDNDPFVNIFASKPSSEASSSGDVIPRPDYVMIIALKWIYKVKLDEYGDVLKNKARLVAKGYRQEEGIDFEIVLLKGINLKHIQVASISRFDLDKMADENFPAPAPTRSNYQILPFAAWVPIRKSNYVLDLQKKQKNPIFQISMDILVFYKIQTSLGHSLPQPRF